MPGVSARTQPGRIKLPATSPVSNYVPTRAGRTPGTFTNTLRFVIKGALDLQTRLWLQIWALVYVCAMGLLNASLRIAKVLRPGKKMFSFGLL